MGKRNSAQRVRHAAQERRRRANNREKCRKIQNAASFKWRANNLVEFTMRHKIYSLKYRSSNPEKVKDSHSNYLKTHATEVAITHAVYLKAHPEYYVDRRIREKNAFVEKVSRQVIFDRDKGICGECENLVDPQNWHLDHVKPLSKGGLHCYANVQVTHPICNLRKATL